VDAYVQGSGTGDRRAWIHVLATCEQVHDDKCEEGAECIIVAYFRGKRDFMPVNMKAQ